MALDFQLAAVKFTDGLDTRTQPKLVVPGKWLALDNLAISQKQTPERRDGVTNLIAGRTGNGLALRNEQLIAINSEKVYSPSFASQTAPQVTGTNGCVGIAKKEVQ